MTEENTKDLTDSEKLNLILAELADLRVWRAKVDAFIDDRSRDTRPKLELIHKEVADTRADIGEIKRELKLLREDMWQERKARIELEERVSSLEVRPA